MRCTSESECGWRRCSKQEVEQGLGCWGSLLVEKQQAREWSQCLFIACLRDCWPHAFVLCHLMCTVPLMSSLELC